MKLFYSSIALTFALLANSASASYPNQFKNPEDLDYPEKYEVSSIVGKKEDFQEGFQYGKNEFLTLNDDTIRYIKSAPVNFDPPWAVLHPHISKFLDDNKNITPWDLEKGLHTLFPGNPIVFKQNIELVEMSQMKILRPEDGKDSLLTLHVFPCVAITAFNKKTGVMGMAHIPGSCRDEFLNFDANPLTEPSKAGKERVPQNVFRNGVKSFLSKVLEEGAFEDVEIKLFGGYKNRELLLSTAKEISQLGHILHINQIYWGHYGQKEQTYNFNTTSKFDLLMNADGRVSIVKEKHDTQLNGLTFLEFFEDELKKLKGNAPSLHIEAFERQKEAFLESQRKWKMGDEILNDLYMTSMRIEGKSEEHAKKFDQFERLYLVESGKEEVFFSPNV